MEWWLILTLMLGGLILLMLLGMPVAFAFLTMNTVCAYFLWGGVNGFDGVIRGLFESITVFSLLPLPLFILMGEAMYNSGLVLKLIDALDKLLGRMPGRLGLLALGGGTLLATLTGASMGSTAMLGSTLVPEMEKRGYQRPMRSQLSCRAYSWPYCMRLTSSSAAGCSPKSRRHTMCRPQHSKKR
jgi:TRAP-type mannitol/chloroaromatic compound transport system permease large subunit